MAALTPSPTVVSLKLMLDPKSKRLVFAEAGRDFVDFLFNIISLPSGTMIRLLSKQGMFGRTGGDSTFVNPITKASSSGEACFVKGAVSYMIMDDLVVRPMTTESIITLLNKFKIKRLGDLEVKVVDVGVDEGVELLRASMQSKNVLTAVFLAAKKESSYNVRVGAYCCFSWLIKCFVLFFCFSLAVKFTIEEFLSEIRKGRKSPW